MTTPDVSTTDFETLLSGEISYATPDSPEAPSLDDPAFDSPLDNGLSPTADEDE